MKLLSRIEEERGRLVIWAPLFLGTGIGLYFAMAREPGIVLYSVQACAILACLAVAWRWPWGYGPLALAIALTAFGFCLAGARAHLVGDPVLGFRYYGAVEGRIVVVDRSQSQAVRLTLDQVRLDDVAPRKLPGRVRVSLHGEQGYLTPRIGQRVAMTAHLSGPNGPVEPGGFDFQRMAWFRGIGAVGYTRVPALVLTPPDRSWDLAVTRMRQDISHWVRSILPGEAGAFAAAITTGDRSAMSQDTIEALRGSNLAHLLAISGLHMGLLTGFVFQAARLLLGLWPMLSLRYPVKKLAAIIAIGAGAFYLSLSGGAIATERAFIMVTTMFVGILFDRRALTLRAVALAALIVLCLTPEALTEPGFQMSFAATTALVAVFGGLRERARDDTARRLPKWARPVVAVAMSSAIAGLATAPIGAAHFNQVSHYGLVANILSVPVMGTVIMPLAVLAAVLAPVGLGWGAVLLMDWPIRWIIWVAGAVSSLDGAIGKVVSPPGAVLPLVALGGLMLVLLRGRERVLAFAPACAAFLLWAGAERPPVLISEGGGLVGVMTGQGRALSKPRGEGFSARSWLENDGDKADQNTASQRDGFEGHKGYLMVDLGAVTLVQISGREAEEKLPHACIEADVVVLSAWREEDLPDACAKTRVIDRIALKDTGAVALWPGRDGAEKLRIEPVRHPRYKRLWSR